VNVVGQGIDLIECQRVASVLRRHGRRFLDRLLTPAEQAYCNNHRNPIPRVAGRFAGKEAVLKMLGTGWRGKIAWTDIEITNDPAGQPQVRLSGQTAAVAAARGVCRILISIAHTPHYATASAIGLAAD
jgi:holo-[acyl-carrier protein] synthase